MAVDDQIVTVGEGDTRPIMTLTLYTRDTTGTKTVADLSGVGTTAKLTMTPLDSSTAKIAAAAMSIVAPGTGGIVQYSWVAANTDTPGEYRAKVKVTYTGGAIETFPNKGYFRVIVTERD